MKTLILPFFILPVILAWSDSGEKKTSIKNIQAGTVIRKHTTKKKDIIASYQSAGKKWNADASAAKISFSVKGIFGMVHGSLSGLKSTIVFDEDDLGTSLFEASVDAKTINTGIKLRNSDLQKEKYLNSDKYPVLSFQSDKIQKTETGYKALGNLTIKGVSKHIEIPFSFSKKGNAGIFKGSFTIERGNFGIGSPGGSIGDNISVDLEVPVTSQN